MSEKDILSKLTAHEKAVAAIVDKHRTAASKLQAELTAAENVLVGFETMPTEAAVPAALAAVSTAANAKTIIARLGPVDRRELALRDSYVAQNFKELFALVESLQEVRTAPRDNFRKAIASKLSPLQTALTLNPNDWAVIKQVETLEKIFDGPDFTLSHAADALRDFKQAPTHANFLNAKDAALRIEFPSL